MASSPVFVHHLVVPMSDVPAATFLDSLDLARGGQFIAGLGGGRGDGCNGNPSAPNTVNAALTAALVAWRWLRRPESRGGSVRSAIGFGAGFAPGVVLVALVNDRLCGSPLLSGYGPLADLFTAWDHGWANGAVYALVHSVGNTANRAGAAGAGDPVASRRGGLP